MIVISDEVTTALPTTTTTRRTDVDEKRVPVTESELLALLMRSDSEHVVTAALPATVLVIGAEADLWQLDILTELRRRTES